MQEPTETSDNNQWSALQ